MQKWLFLVVWLFFTIEVSNALSIAPLSARSAVISPDGKWVAATQIPINYATEKEENKSGARVWNVKTGEMYRNFAWHHASWFLFTPDSQNVILQQGEALVLINLTNNRLMQQWELDGLGKVEQVGFSLDGQWLWAQAQWIPAFTYNGANIPAYNTVRFWRWQTDKDSITQKVEARRFDLKTENGTLVIKPFKELGIEDWCVPESRANNSNWGRTVSYDGTLQAISDYKNRKLTVWRTEDCELMRSLDTFSPSLQFSPQQRWLIFANSQVIELKSDKPPLTIPHHMYGPSSVGFSSDETLIAVPNEFHIYTGSDRTIVSIYNLETGQVVARMS